MSDPSRRKLSFLYSLLQYVCLIVIVAVTVAPTHLFAGQKHEQRRAARLARHQSKHSASTSSSSYTEIYRHQSR